MTQQQQILDYISRHGSITQLDAVKDLGCLRLGARVFDLKQRGYPIVRQMETRRNRFGQPTTYARYFLQGEEKIC